MHFFGDCAMWVSERSRSSVGRCRDGLIHPSASKRNSLALGEYHSCQGQQTQSMQLPRPLSIMVFMMYKVDVVKFYKSSFFIAEIWVQFFFHTLRRIQIGCLITFDIGLPIQNIFLHHRCVFQKQLYHVILEVCEINSHQVANGDQPV